MDMVATPYGHGGNPDVAMVSIQERSLCPITLAFFSLVGTVKASSLSTLRECCITTVQTGR